MKNHACDANDPPKMNPQSYEHWIKKLDHMTHEELAKLYRFAPVGHIVFSDTRLHAKFTDVFKRFGGMTPEISKRISGS